MENKKVWLIVEEWAQDYETGMNTYVFDASHESEALNKLEELIRAAECDYDNEDYIRDRNQYHYEVYEEGYWHKTHCSITLDLVEVQ